MPIKPTPRIGRRPINQARLKAAQDAGYSDLCARLLAARDIPIEDSASAIRAVRPELSALNHYRGLAGIERAATRICAALLNKETIALETDHDVDGVTSHAILYRALTEHLYHPADKIQSYIGHRLRDGYGLSDPVCDRILAADPRPALVITADNGSSDHDRIARLSEHNIDVIVTDHHELPSSSIPEAAYAVITPQHPDNAYPDKHIAGCMVAWLLACAVRNEYLEINDRMNFHIPSMTSLLDYVAVGTVADCVSLGASSNNRAVVNAGLKRINAQNRPCWRAICPVWPGQEPVTAADLAFTVGPRINARGRLDEAMTGVQFLLSETDAEAKELAQVLETENTHRKCIENGLKQQAMAAAAEQFQAGCTAFVVWLPDGHPGVHGIVASRLVETYGRPAVCLSPKYGDDALVTGSARGVPGFHVRDALQSCADAAPDLFIAFGGHEGAGGLTINRERIEDFRARYDAAAAAQLDGVELGPIIHTDGELQCQDITLETIDQVNQLLSPFGRGFEPPLFTSRFTALEVQQVGDGSHLRLKLRPADSETQVLRAIWFNAVTDDASDLPVAAYYQCSLVYELQANDYQGRHLQLIVRGAF